MQTTNHQNQNPFLAKIKISHSIVEDLLQISNIQDLESLATLIKEHKAICNKLFWARANANTGKTAMQAVEDLKNNETNIKKKMSQLSWEEIF